MSNNEETTTDTAATATPNTNTNTNTNTTAAAPTNTNATATAAPTTLAGREVVIGKAYPHWVERVFFLIGLVIAIVFANWMMNESGFSQTTMWLIGICGLPLFVVLFADVLNRFLQFKFTAKK